MKPQYAFQPAHAGAVIALVTLCVSLALAPQNCRAAPPGSDTSLTSRGADVDDPAVPMEPAGSLSLPAAIDLARRNHPGLSAAESGVRAADARTRQAGVRPNPEMEFTVSEYDRDGAGFDSAEVEWSLSQRLELGGKRHWRTSRAQAEGALAGWDFDAAELDVRAETIRRFVAVAAAQQRIALASEAVSVAERAAHAVELRVQAGKEPPLQASKADAELEMARMDQEAAKKALTAARTGLAALWGRATARFEAVEEQWVAEPAAPAGLEVFSARLETVSEWRRWDDEVRSREAAVSAEQAARLPDVDLSAGIQRFQEDESDALLVGVALPLPLFDRNRGGIEAARHELEKARSERRAAQVALRAELADAYASLDAAYGRAHALRVKVVPSVEQAFDAAHEGYQQGKFGYLDLLDAQRSLFAARAERIEAVQAYHNARSRIERLAGIRNELDGSMERQAASDNRVKQ